MVDHHDITLLLNSELDDFIGNPEAYKATIAQRRIDYLALYELEPPFFLTERLPLSQWPKRSAAAVRTKLTSGQTIQGTPGSPGVARGIARIVTDPFELGEFGPGDVLVAPSTDPAWTPLFVPAAAVVVNVGAMITHAVIISRELGVPCVVSAEDATLRIPDGATVEVNGTTGVITVL
jgi:pyruvate,water dikinase